MGGDGVRGGALAVGGGHRGRRAARPHRAGAGGGAGRGAGGGARAGPGAPGREAVERPAHARRAAADRLRHRTGHGRYGVPDLHGRVDRLARLHVARTDPRQGRHGRGGRLLARRGPDVRGDRRTALPRGLLGGPPLQGRPRGAGTRRAGGAVAGADGGLPGEGPGRAARPRRGRPAAGSRGRGPAGGGRVAAGAAGGAGEPRRRAVAEPGGDGAGGRPGALRDRSVSAARP
ncbi:hypothetical protein QFZ43_003750 [Streptomyces afghaniensis]|nr:hypothetical protein [Streptomyces afghaniensis]